METIIQQIGTDFIEKVLESLRDSEIVSIGKTAQQLLDIAWSEHGIRQMAMVRVYVKNGGVICASDVRVSRKVTDLKSDSEAFKKGFSKYRAYADKQIGAFLKNKIDWGIFERSNIRTGKIDGTRMLIKAYSRVDDTTASSQIPRTT